MFAQLVDKMNAVRQAGLAYRKLIDVSVGLSQPMSAAGDQPAGQARR
jgi:hypothetical protein